MVAVSKLKAINQSMARYYDRFDDSVHLKHPQISISKSTTNAFNSIHHIAQLSTTTYHDARATPTFVQGHLLPLHPCLTCRDSPCLPIPYTTSSRSCHSSRCSPTTQEDTMGRVEGSGSYLPESLWTPRSGFGECEEVWRLAQNQGDSTEGSRLGRFNGTGRRWHLTTV